MQPEKVTVESFALIGPEVETTNQAEMNPETAKIMGAWNTFMGLMPELSQDPQPAMFGVYYAYESDHNGKYKVMPAVKHANQNHPQCATVQIQGGTYLKFSFKGEIPEAVIKGWQTVWAYFEENADIKRAYATDFEEYTADGVNILIGLK